MPSKTEIIAQIDGMRKELKRLKKLLGALPEETAVAVAGAPKRSKAKKDPSAPKRALNAWQSWTVYAKETYPEQMAEFAAADDANKSGLAPKFASYLRECMPEEYTEFVANFKTKKSPMPVSVPVPVPMPVPVAPASVSSSSEDEADVEGDAGKQWQWKGKSYFRTEANECWYEKSGKMVWAGVYDPISDSMDADAEEPEVEFD